MSVCSKYTSLSDLSYYLLYISIACCLMLATEEGQEAAGCLSPGGGPEAQGAQWQAACPEALGKLCVWLYRIHHYPYTIFNRLICRYRYYIFYITYIYIYRERYCLYSGSMCVYTYICIYHVHYISIYDMS